MAAVTLLGTQTFTTSSGTKTVVATPAVGDLIVLVVAHTGNTSATAPTDNNSDGLGTYTLINTAVKASSADTMKMWVRNALIGSASSTTFSTAPGTSTGGGLGVFKITGMSRYGSNAVRQSAIQSNQSSSTTPTPALAGAATALSALIGAVFNATSAAGMTPRGSPTWSERFDVGYSTPTTGLETMTINSGETASSIAWGGTSASAFASIVAEFDPSTNNSDRNAAAPFVVRRHRSRRFKDLGWNAGMAGAPAAPPAAVPVSAWACAAQPVTHRRDVKRALVSVPPPPLATIAPSAVLFVGKPKVIKIEFKRTLMKAAPQLLFPPPTGPPNLYPAWLGLPFVRSRATRRALKREPGLASTTPTPPPPSPDSAISAPFVTKNARSRRLQRQASLASFPATPAALTAQGYPAWLAAAARKISHERGVLAAPASPVFPLAASSAPISAWTAPKATRTAHLRKGLTLPRLGSYPATPVVEASPDRAIRAAFVTARAPSRKLQKLAFIPAAATAAPGTSDAPLAAFTQRPVRKRKSRPGLFLSGGGVVEARVQPQWPSYAAAVQLLRRATEYRRLAVTHGPSYPVTPVPTPPISAWAAKVAMRTGQRRTLLAPIPPPSTPLAASDAPLTAWQRPEQFKQSLDRTELRVPKHEVYPTTAPVPEQPVTAWQLKTAHRRHGWRELAAVPRLDSYPAPASVPPEVAWRAVRPFGTEQERKLQPAAAQITYPLPHPISATPRVDAIRRRETKRVRRTLEHEPSYPPTPVPEQPPTAYLAKTVFRRHGWTAQRRTLEIDHYVYTTFRGYLVGVVRVIPAIEAEIRIVAALNAEVRLRPEE